ncbi:MAG: sugar ABC transporter ATP-binding protein [Anaerolineaceae bacterium]|jgi:ABC-type sugar transport system ATPase subunit|nr:MAG: sugar ABC transporter ATP-binding protein [Anaerolineaceae bacterium]
MQGDGNILTLSKVSKEFPGVKALNNVDFTLRKGEVHALVGENGAGKSTLMKILSGAYSKDSGTIEFDGKEVEITSPKASEKMGISIIYQELNLIHRMSVAENIFLGRAPKKNGVIQWKKMYKNAKELFNSFDIEMDVSKFARDFSIAQQQIIEIIKAVSINAKVVIMDEPTSSLTDNETKILFRIIKSLKSKGIAVIFITHRLDEVFEISDRLTVLRDGCYIGTKDVKDITKSELIKMMIGRELKQQFPQRNIQIGEECFRVDHISDGNKIMDVSFCVRKGEVLGFAGLVGAGRTETMRLIFGADKKTNGKIFINNKEVHIKRPKQSVGKKIGFVTENRKEEGLFLRLPVRNNIVAVAIDKIKSLGVLNFKKEKYFSDKYVQELRINTPSINQKAVFLSGGNQQKVVLAKWLLSDSEIVILDEPTRGIDVGAKREIFEIINQLADQGKAIIFISSEMEEILGISDRILVMHEGKISGEVSKENFSERIITEYAFGGA